jgi:hypothetical protein
VRYQDTLISVGDSARTETIKVSKETFDSLAVHSDIYKAKAAEAASAAAEAASLRKELEKTKEPMTTRVVAWFKR